MDTYNQQDELDKLKDWWKHYGNALIVGVLIGVSLLFGNKYWNQYQERQRQEASSLYEELLVATRGRQPEKTRTLGDRLVNEFSSTPYAGLAALMLARHHLDAGERDLARQRLEWAIKNTSHETTAHAARLRLGRLLAEGGDAAGALALADVKNKAGFESEYAELRGDLLTMQGRPDEARSAYREALKESKGSSSGTSVLRLKLEDLGPDKSP